MAKYVELYSTKATLLDACLRKQNLFTEEVGYLNCIPRQPHCWVHCDVYDSDDDI